MHIFFENNHKRCVVDESKVEIKNLNFALKLKPTSFEFGNFFLNFKKSLKFYIHNKTISRSDSIKNNSF